MSPAGSRVLGSFALSRVNGAVTFTLGFYVSANLLDGRFHELKVHVKRSGL